jgi:pimeloyl-ACP methyl ester carboxylesterase
MKELVVRLLVLGFVLALLVFSQWSPPPTTAPSTPEAAPSGMVDVGGYRLFYTSSGRGSPTVVLEAGSGDSSDVWADVVDGLEGTTRVFGYDRANLGQSDKGIQAPRTIQDMARDLHALLVGSHVGGPYILVGHSMGGLVVRAFADRYPEEVAGMVLVDAAHPDMGPRLLAGLPPESADEPASIAAWRRYFTYLAESEGENDPEGTDLPTSYAQLKAARSLGDLPLVVISRNPENPELTPFPMPSLPTETIADLQRIWLDLQGELARLSSRGTLLIASQAGHYVQTEEPKLVTDAVLRLVTEARARGIGGAATPAVGPGPVGNTAGRDHAPVILRVEERKETANGQTLIHKDIHFTDAAGDAAVGVIRLVSTTPPNVKGLRFEDDTVLAAPEEQRHEAVVTSTWQCGSAIPGLTVVVEYRLRDKAGNLSEPVTITVSCP